MSAAEAAAPPAAPPQVPAAGGGASVGTVLAQGFDAMPAAAGGRRTRDEGLHATLDKAQKAAIVLVALGPEELAGEMLRDLGEANIRRFAAAVSRLNEIPHETVDLVIEEFVAFLGDDLTVRGGLSEARKFLGRVLDEESLARVLEDIDARAGRSVWQRLSDASDGQLSAFLSGEHAQVACVVLAKLRSDQAARLLERFEPAFAQDVVLRMSRTPNPDSGALDLLKATLERDFVAAVERTQGARKPSELIAGLMNHVSGAARESFLQHLESADAKLAQEVQRVMFTFTDIASRVGPRDVAAVARSVEEPTLLVALKAALDVDDPSAEFILGNMSKRLADRLREDVEMLPAPSRKEGEAAMAEVVGVVQTLARAGEIKLIEIEGAD